MSIASILIFLKARSLRSLTSIDPLLNKEMKFLNALAMFEFVSSSRLTKFWLVLTKAEAV